MHKWECLCVALLFIVGDKFFAVPILTRVKDYWSYFSSTLLALRDPHNTVRVLYETG
jgi:hypothetical protein